MAPQAAPPSGQFLLITALIQSVVYAVIWLWNEYVASFLTLIFPSVILVVLILSKIADWIEPSRIPSWYYKVMIASIFIPPVIAAIFYFIYEGRIDWLKDL
jgi:hypothetical protein